MHAMHNSACTATDMASKILTLLKAYYFKHQVTAKCFIQVINKGFQISNYVITYLNPALDLTLCNATWLHIYLHNCQRWARTGSDCIFFENWRIRTGSVWENSCCFYVIIPTASKILVFMWFYRFVEGSCIFCHQWQKLCCDYFAIRTASTFVQAPH